MARAWPQTKAGGQQSTLEARRCLGLTFEAHFFLAGVEDIERAKFPTNHLNALMSCVFPPHQLL